MALGIETVRVEGSHPFENFPVAFIHKVLVCSFAMDFQASSPSPGDKVLVMPRGKLHLIESAAFGANTIGSLILILRVPAVGIGFKELVILSEYPQLSHATRVPCQHRESAQPK